MDHQHIRNVIRRENEEMWHASNPQIFQESSHDHRVTHTVTFGDIVGHDAHSKLAQMYLDAFTDHRMRIDHLVVEGDHAAYRITHQVKHTGAYLGIEPTGNDVKIVMSYFVRFEGDRIAESWMMWDSLLLLRQLGVEIPMDPSPKA
ncbi:ester cyclase (plasmid) [Deinococcus sp. KNUC1210]|uniref:ester cyclase n=1 Tax=Deinococcus sp. KNUC1210 TaxID=2917691 RepID=UPI001EF139DE|nr:ester cyclase [Deinococcus sp. KNUC1210]ULH17615.1 ester cyclase [Deinococcus sp. KNUC1210]